MTFKKLIFNTFLYLCILIVSLNVFAEYKVINLKINSSILNEKRDISIYLPDNYEKTSDSYPIMFVLDGEDFGKLIASTVEYYSIIGKIPSMIVVGINSKNRWKDYTPTHANIPDGTPLPESGGGENFYKFISQELAKYLKNNYRTSSYYSIYGHSIAALFVVDSVLKENSIFNSGIATSPSLWWDNEYLFNNVSKSKNRQLSGKRLYMTMGNEGDTMMVPAQNFAKALQQKLAKNAKFDFVSYKDVSHQVAPFKEFPYSIEFIFYDWELPSKIMKSGLKEIIQYYDNLSKVYLKKVKVPESLVNHLGYMALNKKDFDKAIKIFNFNVNQYPESANVYDSLGEAYLKSGNKKMAKQCYEKALSLNPNNQNAQKILNKIKKL